MGLYSYTTSLGKRMLISLRTNPSKQRRMPFSSDRQHERHARRQFTVTTRNGFEIMQTRRAA